MELLHTARRMVLRGYLKILRRNQFTSRRLRDIFFGRFDVEVGNYSYGCFDAERIRGPVKIGRYCSIAESVRIIDANHPVANISTHPYFYDPTFGVVQNSQIRARKLVIEDDVWIGHNCVILPGCCHIGRGSVIGAGSIVTKDVDAYMIVGGVPARSIRSRFDLSTSARIEASQWWLLEPEQAYLAFCTLSSPQLPKGNLDSGPAERISFATII